MSTLQEDLHEAARLLRAGEQSVHLARVIDQFAAAMDAASPVAWMVRDDAWNQAFSTREQANTYGKELQPLYTHPAPPASEVVEALRLILPMAKGYAHANPVGRNAEFIAQAEKALANLTGANNG